MVDKVDRNRPIPIVVEIPLTDAEYQYQVELFERTRSERIREEVRLHFSLRKSMREIAKIKGVSKSQVCKDLRQYRDSAINSLRNDIRKTLTAFVELTEQVYTRMRVLNAKYEELDECIQVIRAGIRRDAERLRKNPAYRVREQDKRIAQAREIRILVDSQSNIISRLRSESQQLLDIYQAFGLCVQAPAGLTNIEEGYLGEKLAEIKELSKRLVHIVKDEVENKSVRMTIFNRLAEEITVDGLRDWGQQEEPEDYNDFRL